MGHEMSDEHRLSDEYRSWPFTTPNALRFGEFCILVDALIKAAKREASTTDYDRRHKETLQARAAVVAAYEATLS